MKALNFTIPTKETAVAVANPLESKASAALSLASDDFSLFGLNPRFDLDLPELHQRWMALQTKAHPDQFAADNAAAQRLATQWSVRINEAYQRLKNPLSRAIYLCHLNSVEVGAESNTAMPSAFLMQQMQWHEDLDDAQAEADLDVLHAEVSNEKTRLFGDVAQQLDAKQDYASAVENIRRLMFVEKIENEIEKKIDGLVANS